MNVFFVDRNPRVAARQLCDVHVVKMAVESAQVLSTARHHLGLDAPYKPTHPKHPCVLWAREGIENFLWLHEHALGLCEEYTHRYGKLHGTAAHLEALLPGIRSALFAASWTEPAQAMPDEYKRSDAVEAYRAFYHHKAATLPRFTYKNRQAPGWLKNAPRSAEEA